MPQIDRCCKKTLEGTNEISFFLSKKKIMKNRVPVTRFGESNVPPVLYHVALRDEWMASATHYSPSTTISSAHAQSVPLCDLDRLDEFASRGYFMPEYNESIAREEVAASSMSGKAVRFFTTVSLTFASALGGGRNSNSLNSASDGVSRKFMGTPRHATVRLSELHTHINSPMASLVERKDYVLIVLSVRDLRVGDDLAWDYVDSSGPQDVTYPRLTRPLHKLEDVHAEVPLRYDTKLRIVALPSRDELDQEFNVTRGIARALDS